MNTLSNNNFRSLLKTYDKKIMVDKITGGVYDTNSPHSTTLHRHNDFQIVWISKGQGVHFVEQKQYNYQAGSVFLLAPYFMHQIEYNEEVEGYVISFSDTFLNLNQSRSALMFYNAKNCFVNLPEPEIDLFDNELSLLYKYYKFCDYNDVDMIKQNYLHIILLKIARFLELDQGVGKSNIDQELLERFILLVRDNFHIEKNLEFYSTGLAVSQRKLSDVISRTTGLSPGKFVEVYTLNEAARLLCYSSYQVKEIAAMLGYFDNSYFTKAFRRYFAMTPNQYRNSKGEY